MSAGTLLRQPRTLFARVLVTLVVPVVLAACSQAPAWEPCTAEAGSAMRVGPVVRSGETGAVLHWRGEDRVLIGHSMTQAWMELGADFDSSRYLDDLHGAGVNALLLWSFIGTSADSRRKDFRIGYASPTRWPWPGQPEQADFDLDRFSPAYFEDLQGFVRAAGERDIVVILMVHDGWLKDRFARHPFNAALGNGPLTGREQYVELARYGCTAEGPGAEPWRVRNQKLQEAFAAKLVDTLSGEDNVIFELFNEGEWYPPAARAMHERHFVGFFRTRAAMTMSNIDHILAFDPAAPPLPDLISIHKPQVDSKLDAAGIFAHVAAYRRPGRPVIFSETVPALGRGDYPRTRLLDLLWATLLAGGHITVQDDTAFRYAPRAIANARREDGEWLLGVLAVANRLARDYPLAGLTPAPERCSTGVCAELRNGALVGFVAAPGVTVEIDAGSGAFGRVRWLDTGSGEWQPAEAETRARRLLLKAPAGQVLFVLDPSGS